ncbi:MAG TPA: Na+/H+ antiporter NhaA [Dehalococcoidia bacterium]|nr:Na+/H+ antiporter NhaA [Dehalococcoidia bacterium]
MLFARPRNFVYRRVFQTAQNFMQVEAASGVVMLAAAIAALIWANSPWWESYLEFWHTELFVEAELFVIHLDLREWVNDALMTIFFFVVGLEIKRELVHGELSNVRRALLPAAGALGGMAAPALIYTAVNLGGEGAKGWGVPMATDIAFAVGVLSLLSRRVPFSLKVFLLALAIADDIGAILVIAVFYTSDLNFLALGLAALTLVVIAVMNRSGIRTINVYVAAGAVLWLMMLQSGIHATIAGVTLGLMAPASYFYNPKTFVTAAQDLLDRFRLAEETENEEIQAGILAQMEDLTQGTEAPLDRLERALHRWVSFGIVPLFALANAGVHVSSETADAAIGSPVSQGVFFGLLFGKPIGIFLVTWLAVKLRICEMPTGSTWPQVLSIGMLGGIGFTVALLITDLGFERELLIDEAKLGVLTASLVAGVLGFGFLWLTTRGPHEATDYEATTADA